MTSAAQLANKHGRLAPEGDASGCVEIETLNPGVQAAHAMVRCLAGSLAMVTCKEPLRSALAQHLRQLLQVRAACACSSC